MSYKIAILTGGDSSEREVALASSKNVIRSLEAKHQLEVFDFPKDIDKFLKTYKNFQAAVPVFHGPGGEDGLVQGFLETLKMPYVFSKVAAHSLAMDKSITKILAEKNNIKTAKSLLLDKAGKLVFKNKVVIKPIVGGSSIGIDIVDDQVSLDKAIAEAFKYADKVLIEDYIKGREFTVPVVETREGLKSLSVIEIVSKNKFFDYQSKYDNKLADEICPARIDDKLAVDLQDRAMKMHKILGIRHISRSDFIVNEQGSYFLETNTIPGMTNESLLPKAIRQAGLNWGDLLDFYLEQVIHS